MTNSRRKGHNFERDIVRLYSPGFGRVHRGDQSRSGSDAADVEIEGLPGLWVECKIREKIALYQWWKQAVEAATDGRLPVLHIRQNQDQGLVVVSEDLYFRMLRAYVHGGPGGPLKGNNDGTNERDPQGRDGSVAQRVEGTGSGGHAT